MIERMGMIRIGIDAVGRQHLEGVFCNACC